VAVAVAPSTVVVVEQADIDHLYWANLQAVVQVQNQLP